jgi:hypothetical protein
MKRREILAAVFIVTAGCSSDKIDAPNPGDAATTLFATGAIAAKVTEFGALLGDPANGGTAGEQPAGRREINWDGAGAFPFNNKNDFPASFFNSNVKAGAVFTTPGTGFRNDSTFFAGVNAGYATQLSAFSANKIFSPVGSNVMDVLFQVAGQPTPAQVTGFGAVFSDVDAAEATTIEFFDAFGFPLLKITVPVRSEAGGLSFAGAKFPSAIVARVRITLGTAALSATNADVSAGGTGDIVAADNFLFGEPKRIP